MEVVDRAVARNGKRYQLRFDQTSATFLIELESRKDGDTYVSDR